LERTPPSTIVRGMPKRRSAVLLCGQARETLAAIARELARTDIPLLIQAATGEIEAAQRLCRALSGDARVAQVISAELGGEAASRRLVQTAWKAARGLEAVIICPALPKAAEAAEPDLDAWDAGIARGLRAPLLLAKHAGLRLARADGGRLVFAVGAPCEGHGPMASVVHAGLQCMVAALAKALPSAVAVTAVIGGGRQPAKDTALQIARGVRFFVEADRPPSGAVLELGDAAPRG
jgi:NAD(P)-dependent dehydrogenase (short-subunit alcohol dehydrogenase family)